MATGNSGLPAQQGFLRATSDSATSRNDAARDLLQARRWPDAFAQASNAFQEAGKVLIAHEVFTGASTSTDNLAARLRDHREKAAFGEGAAAERLFGGVVSSGSTVVALEHLYQYVTDETGLTTDPPPWERYRQAALYTDMGTTGPITPEQSVTKEMAEVMYRVADLSIH